MSKTSTLPFTKDEMGAELRETLYIQASQIAHSGSQEAACTFLGFACEFSPARSPGSGEIEQIDLARFPAWQYMSTAYDYAFQVGQCWRYDESNNHDIIAFSGGITPEACYGDRSPFLDSNSKCRHVVDLAVGRWHLDVGDGRELTVRQLALLAGMSEAAVRNSLSTEKIRPPVDAETALAWLNGRKGFVPTRANENRQAFWSAHTHSLVNASRLDDGLRTILLDLSLTPDAAAQRAGVPVDVVHSLLANSPAKASLEDLKKIGAALDLDVPYFVGQAIEAALRQAG